MIMLGRTHLQDATPVTLGQASAVGRLSSTERSPGSAPRSRRCTSCPGRHGRRDRPQRPPPFGDLAARRIAEETGRPFRGAPDKFAALSAHDPMVAASAALRTLAVAAMKIANDVRWYASGPRAGIGELLIPENEPGSSIMPGKINPTQSEALTQVVVQVFGCDAAVAFAGSQGNFQLNVYKPVMLDNLLRRRPCWPRRSAPSTTTAPSDRAEPAPDPPAPREPLMLVTALNPHIGYEKSAEIALHAHRNGTSLRDAARELGYDRRAVRCVGGSRGDDPPALGT